MGCAESGVAKSEESDKAMKKKKRVSGARKKLGGSTPEPESPEQSLPYQEPKENPIMQAGTSQENSMKRDAPLQSLSQPEGRHPGSWLTSLEGLLHPNNLTVSSSWPLSAMLQTSPPGDPRGTDGEGISTLHMTAFAEDQVQDRSMECSPCVTLLSVSESGPCETCPEPTDTHQTTGTTSFLCVDGGSMEHDGRDSCCQSGDIKEVSLIGTCSEWTATITSSSGLHTNPSCLEEDNSTAQEPSPDLSAVSDVQVQLPQITEPCMSIPGTLSPIQTDKSQPSPPDTQGVKNTSCFSGWEDNLSEQVLDFSHEQKSESVVLLSPELDRKANRDPAPQCLGDPTPVYEGHSAPPGEGDSAHIYDVDTASQCFGYTNPTCQGERVPPCERDLSPPCEEHSNLQREGDHSLQYEGDPAPPCEGDPAPPCEIDHTPPHEGDPILVQGRNSVLVNSGEPATVLDVPDSQLLGALEESFCEPDQTLGPILAEENIKKQREAICSRKEPCCSARGANACIVCACRNVDDPVTNRETSTSDEQATPPGDTGQPTLVMTPRGQPESRGEDASSTVQGLIAELSNLNRLIMSTYRELRQKRVRFPPGRGAASGKRRREM